MHDLVERGVLQHVVLAGHQDLRDQMRKDGQDIQLRFPNHNQQILIDQEDLMVPLVCINLEQFVEMVKGGLLHPFYESTSSLIACTTQTKTSVMNL